MILLEKLISFFRYVPKKVNTPLKMEGIRVLSEAIQSLSQVSQDIAADLVREKLSNESRLRLLKATGLLEASSEESFDRITYIASKVLKTPMSFVNLVDEKNVRILSKYSLNPAYDEIDVVPSEQSICAYEVALNKPLAIRDIRDDTFAQSMPIRSVTDLGLISYLGVPLQIADQLPIGTLCACDSVPRNWSADDVHILTELAKVLVSLIVLKRAQTAQIVRDEDDFQKNMT